MKWEIFRDNHKPLKENVIDGVEKILGCKFPSDYRECVTKYHGGQPANDSLTIDVSGSPWGIGFGELLTLDPLSGNTNVLESTATLRNTHESPSWYIPIVLGGAGDHLCLDYSENKEDPRIVFWFHELEFPESIYPWQTHLHVSPHKPLKIDQLQCSINVAMKIKILFFKACWFEYVLMQVFY